VELLKYGSVSVKGHIVDGKPRDQLAIESGSALEVEVGTEERGGSITLRPKGQEPALQQKGELLVHTGELTEEDFDVAEHLRVERQKRARRHAGLDV